jgi:hypothetical protein
VRSRDESFVSLTVPPAHRIAYACEVGNLRVNIGESIMRATALPVCAVTHVKWLGDPKKNPAEAGLVNAAAPSFQLPWLPSAALAMVKAIHTAAIRSGVNSGWLRM